ncbi:MAG: sensor histidine kinase [Alphaproteobacteria bacterium]|uniref:Sensor histidine kinase n=1 Tax=Candidatus Nitrobium versatile TaxID=2884831 RepID=A0A953JBG3_9BACT|nr:sensor histidine kinase [Candidatus Nitrobium versatile]
MKIAFSQKIGVRVVFFPMTVLCAAFIVAGVLFYAFSPPYFVQGFHTVHLRNLVAEKRAVFDAWFARSGKYLKILARDRVLLDALPLPDAVPSAAGMRRKGVAEALDKARANVSRRLEEAVPLSPFTLLALVAQDGRVVAASRTDLIGEDWSGKDLIRNALAEAKAAEAASFFSEGAGGGGIFFLTPLFDTGGEVRAVLCAVSPADEPARSLVLQSGVYRTEKVELIDREGNLVLTQGGIPHKKLRYNVPKTGKEDRVRLKDHLYFYASSLSNAPYRLIATVREAEVVHPFGLAKTLYFSFAGILLLIAALQTLLSRRLIDKPATRLLHAVDAAASGGRRPEGEKGDSGELQALQGRVEGLLMELREKEALLRESGARRKEVLPDLLPRLFREVDREVGSFAGEMERVLGRERGLNERDRKTLEGAVHAARGLLPLMEGLLELARTGEGRSEGGRSEDGLREVTHAAAKGFMLCDLLREVEEFAGGLAGAREVEVLAECDESLADSPLSADRDRIRQVMMNLAVHAVESSDSGVVTVLSTQSVRGGKEYLEISVAHSGKGSVPGREDQSPGGFSSLAPLRVAVSMSLAEALGGECIAEDEDGVGVVFTVTIPLA